MKSYGRAKTNATSKEQLAAENDWLAGRHLPESLRAMLPKQEINECVRAILNDAQLVPILSIIQKHNDRLREAPRRRGNFLLSPHLRQVLLSVQERDELRQKLPALDQPAAEVRKHLRDVAASCKALAKLIRKGPHPHIALAGESNFNEALKVLAPWTELFEAANGSERQVVALSELMERAGGWFDALADHVPRAKQNRRPGATKRSAEVADLRTRAAEFLSVVFRRTLGHPYHAHVATIATLVSGIETDADFVKKVEAQQSGSKQLPDGETLPQKKTETLT